MSVEIQDFWFSGPITEAISLVNQRNCILLVYIYDDSEKSQTLDKTLNDAELSSVINEKTVALRMKTGSEETTMFGQYYPTAHTPIVYFIQQGTIKDFAVETVSKQDILDKLESIKSIVTPVSNIVTNEPIQSQAGTEQLPDMNTTTTTTGDDDVATAAVEQVSSPITPITTTATVASVSDEAEKKEKIRKQLAEARKLREEREKKEAKEREIKRREQGRDLEKAKQDRIDRENKIYFDKIKKERKADEEHKKKVREQIARDRAEKIASRKAERERQLSIDDDDNNVEQQSGDSSSPSKQQSYNTCNLNIRQLDGSTIRNQFNVEDTLSVVREWIDSNRTDGSNLYRLSAQFPTRTFTEVDDGHSLGHLNLCPSATIIMKPAKKTSRGGITASDNSPNMIVGFASSSFHFIYSLVFNLFQIIAGLLSTLFPRNGLTAREQQPEQEQLRSLRGGQRLGGESSSTAAAAAASTSSTSSSSAAAMKRRNPYSSRVNTLHEEGEDDDDRKKTTYNGNSVNHE